MVNRKPTLDELLDGYDAWLADREQTWSEEGLAGFDTDRLGWSDDDGIELLHAIVAAARKERA